MTNFKRAALAMAIAVISAPSFAHDPACVPTQRDALGPFFVANTPEVDNLNRFGKEGEPMRIEGEIRSAEPPHDPIAGAQVEIWQTDGTGRYYPQNDGDVTDYQDSEIDLRGTRYTDRDGVFSVMSLFPAAYRPRPSHIHYKLSAEGFESLVTQHYLETDRVRDTCRVAQVDRSQSPALFNAPTIYLLPD